ncbi:hypothetical protein BX666DRAFT_1606567 [Dichotomocladium elegans]|nr:hypothetical protein BX666DRAFT_1606567 [Dichotomocladium elegans]
MIPAFHVPPETGDKLFRLITAVTQNLSSQQTDRQAVRILMMPGSIHGTNPWELTLIIMIAVLGIGFVGSVGMHCHLVRKNARLRRQVAQGLIPAPPEMLPMGKQLLDPIYLGKLRTRTIGQENAAEEEEDATQRSGSRLSERPKEGLNSSNGSVDEENDCCVVCLERMVCGDVVRQLPCEHEYHLECIDPWLTTKSGECPLCKFDCVAVLAPPRTEEAIPPSSPPTLLERIQNLCYPAARRQRRRQQQQRQQQNDEETQHSPPPSVPAAPETIEMTAH